MYFVVHITHKRYRLSGVSVEKGTITQNLAAWLSVFKLFKDVYEIVPFRTDIRPMGISTNVGHIFKRRTRKAHLWKEDTEILKDRGLRGC